MELKAAPFKKNKDSQIFPIKGLSYKDSGVDIEAGDSLVNLIKPIAK